MNKLIILLFLGFGGSVLAQCPTGDVTINSLEDLQSFFSNYPTCQHIDGDLNIYGDESLINLAHLQNIKSVSGSLKLIGNSNLTTIERLNIEEIGMNLEIKNNDVLVNLHGLEDLTSIKGDLEYYYNHADFRSEGLENVKVLKGDLIVAISKALHLTDLRIDSIYGDCNFYLSSGLQGFGQMGKLKYVGGKLSIYDTGIQSLSPFSELTSIGGVEIVDNNYYVNLDGLSNLTHIYGNLEMREKSGAGFTPLSKLEYVQGDLEVKQNNNIRLSALQSLKRVDGDFRYVKNNLVEDVVGPPSLEYIGGSLLFDDFIHLYTIEGFSSLDSIAGSVIFSRLFYSFDDFTGLNNVKYIGEDLVFSNIYEEQTYSGFNSLEEIRGNLTIYNCDENIVYNPPPTLQKIGGLHIYYNTNQVDFPPVANLISGYGDMIISSNFELEDLPSFPELTHLDGDLVINQTTGNVLIDLMFPNIETINGSLEVKFADKNFLLPKLKYIGGSITMEHNDELNKLSFLSSMDTLHGDLSLRYLSDLTSLDGLSNVEVINGGLTMTSLRGMSSLEGLENLKNIEGHLTINYSDHIKNLSPLSNLEFVKESINIIDNDSLTSIVGLENINVDSLGVNTNSSRYIYLRLNKNLSECEVRPICELLALDANTLHLESNNGGTCDDRSELNCVEYGVSGIVFVDLNGNGIQDSGENGIPNIKVLSTSSDVIAMTNELGRYRFISTPYEETELILQDYEEDWILTTDSMSFNTVFDPAGMSNSSFHFGLNPKLEYYSIMTDLSSGPTRCNTNSVFRLAVTNSGSVTTTAYASFKTDDNTIVRDTDPYHITPDDGLYRWRLDSMKPYETRFIDIEIQMPSEQSTGEIMTFDYSGIIEEEGDITFENNSAYESLVLCSYDPNDKLATPMGQGEEHYTDRDDILKYTVRFQNTGNAPAIDVRIIDTLDDQLDLSTFEVINSSHVVNTIVNDREVEFVFRNIFLPDSLSNPVGSNGFVTYQIKAIEGLDNFEVIENKADIIFDFNPPIITNVTYNTIVDSLCEDQLVERNIYICSGEDYMGFTDDITIRDTFPYGLYCDSVDVTNLYVVETSHNEYDYGICDGDDYYFDGAYIEITGDTVFRDTIYHKVLNCILEIRQTNLTHIIPTITSIDTLVCDGEHVLGYNETGLFTVPQYNFETSCYDTIILDLIVLSNEDNLCLDQDMDGYPLLNDCDDFNSDVNPAASEIVYNGIDDDCDTSTLDDDLDQDGFSFDVDCDDTNSSIYPGAVELINNGIDEDCDGIDQTSSTITVLGQSINVYPNPTRLEVFIKSPVDLVFDIKLFNMNGSQVMDFRDANVISVKSLSPGTYIMRLFHKPTNTIFHDRIVVTH